MTQKFNPNPATQEPKKDDEWAVHSLNIHGIFFERWCRKMLDAAPSWQVSTTNYPVAVAGHQSALDIRADLRDGGRALMLLIECKKNNPQFVDWVFFPKPGGDASAICAPYIQTVSSQHQNIRCGHRRIDVSQRGVVIADEARETRGDYQSNKSGKDKTKTANNAITEAATQISLATRAIELEEGLRARERAGLAQQPPLHPDTNIVPVIVTTAKMSVCQFDSADISQTGEIPLEKARLVPTPILLYEFPLPNHLQSPLPLGRLDERVRRQIIIVQSTHFSEFLTNFAPSLLPA